MRKTLLMAATAPLAFAFVVPAHAQTAEEDAAASRDGDIIVTARKRQESVIKVPVIASVLSAETLSNSNVVGVAGITQQVAGLTLGGNVLTVGTQIALRGVGTSSLDAGVDQSVSLNIDGLQLTQGATYGVGMFDMAQVEVLKGPQALFFGKNSPGGVIAIRTADPGDELEVIARAQYGFEAKEKRGELIVSAPLGDTLGLRLAGMYSEDDGYFFNKAVAAPGLGGATPFTDRYNGGYEYILRGTLVWKPVSGFSARLKVNNTKKFIVGGGAPIGSCPDGVTAPPGVPQFLSPADNCKIDRTAYIVNVTRAAFPEVRNNGEPFLKYLTSFGTLELNYDVASAVTLTSTTGYYHTRVDAMINGVNSGNAGPTLIADNQFKRHDFTQELRLQSDYDGALNFLVGAYLQDAEVSNRIYVGGNTAFGLPAFLTGGINTVGIKALSGFGQLRFKPSPLFEIAGGVRYTDEKRNDDGGAIRSYFSPVTPVVVGKPKLRSKNWSPELTVTFTPTDDLTIFGALKQGYKSGSYIMTLPPAPGVDNSFGDERVRGGEVGVKMRTPDRALNLSAAFYYYKYSDLQVGANEVAQGGLPVIKTINAASSKVYGVDFEATYRPPTIDGLSARLSVNWNRARFSNFDTAPCYGGQTIADGCNRLLNPATGRFTSQDLSGQPLPKAAEWTATGGFDYDMPAGDSLRLNLGVNGQYSSKFLRGLGLLSRRDMVQPGFFKLNANIGIGAENKAWEVALIGNNLTNKFTAGNCTTFSGATGQIFAPPIFGGTTRNASGVDELACIPDRGREVFLRFTLRPTQILR